MPNLTYKAHDTLLDAWGDSLTLGLLTAAPNPDGTGVTEPSEGGYERKAIAFTKSQEEGVTTLLNDADIVFGPAITTWTTVNYFGLFDTDGDLVVYGRLRTSRTNPSGEGISFPEGTVELRLR